MFTGIVTDIGIVRKVEQRGDLRLEIETGYDTSTIELGASIACSGACLTVVDKGDDWFAVDVSGETVSRTATDRWREGAKLNLERSLRLGDELGGHIVTGHVNSIGEVMASVPKAIRRDRRPGAAPAWADGRAEGLDRPRRRVADGQHVRDGTIRRPSPSTSSPTRRSKPPSGKSPSDNS